MKVEQVLFSEQNLSPRRLTNQYICTPMLQLVFGRRHPVLRMLCRSKYDKRSK